MPLFFFLSGFFLLKKQENFTSFLIKKSKSLIIPYFVYNIILIIFYWLLWLISRSANLYQDIYNQFIAIPLAIRINDIYSSRLWFLPCLFTSNLLIYAISKLSNKSTIIIFIGILLALLGIVLNVKYKLILPWSIDVSLMISIFIISAIIIRKQKFLMNIIRGKIYITSIIVFIIFTYLNYKSSGNKGINIYEANYGNYLYFYLTSFTGIFIVLKIANKIQSNKLLEFLGRNSLTIYVTHYIFLTFCFQLVKFIPYIHDTTTTKSIAGIITSLICIIACIPTIKFINKFFSWSLGRI